jgi:hypothetical protein
MSNSICAGPVCPIILDSTCVFYAGANLIYTGINTNDNLQTAILKIDNKFRDAGLGYVFQNGLVQIAPGAPVELGGSLTQDTVINSDGFTLTVTENLIAGAHVTSGGTSSQFVKGDGSLDNGPYQPAGNYITALTGDGTANGPGVAGFTLATVNPSPGTWGSPTKVPILTIDSKGRVTNNTETTIFIPSNSLSFVGDVTGFGTTGSPVTLTLNTVNANVYGTNTFLKFAANDKGLVTSAAPIVASDIYAVLGFVPIGDAPVDGNIYGRRNASWVVVSGGGGSGTVTSVGVTAGTGISASVTNPTTTPNITITNTAPDQTVVLNNGTGINVTGTYPNFTISATGTGGGTLVALPFTTDHLAITNNQYVIGDLVWYLGDVYRCIANNDSLTPSTSPLYWTNLGAGYPLVQQPANWNSTSGNNQILNKPTIPAAQVNSDWNATSGLAEILNKPTIPTVGTWGALNYPTWVSGTPFVKMTAVGTFSLDTNTYLTSAVTSIATSGLISGGTITSTGTISTSMATNKLVGRSSAGVGVMEEITVGTGLSLSGGTLSATSSASVGFEMNFLLMGA